jgi:hypothetical protein
MVFKQESNIQATSEDAKNPPPAGRLWPCGKSLPPKVEEICTLPLKKAKAGPILNLNE